MKKLSSTFWILQGLALLTVGISALTGDGEALVVVPIIAAFGGVVQLIMAFMTRAERGLSVGQIVLRGLIASIAAATGWLGLFFLAALITANHVIAMIGLVCASGLGIWSGGGYVLLSREKPRPDAELNE